MTDKKLDPSFDPASYYGSASWCAFILGRSVEWFKRNRPELEREGFPKLDRLIGLTLKADVMAWINRRRTIADPSNMLKETRTRADQTNWDAI